jgi:hypothetical protein
MNAIPFVVSRRTASRRPARLEPHRDRQEVLLTEYQEVCRSHAGITDFRAKLLAILPIASGAGVGLLVAQENGDLSSREAALLVALGIFGAVVTAGLFLYELRQIDVCKQLRARAAAIENELGIEAGQFGGRRRGLSLREVYSRRARRRREQLLKAERSNDEGDIATWHTQSPDQTALPAAVQMSRRGALDTPFVGAEAAGYVVYHAVAVAWLVVAAFGVANLS